MTNRHGSLALARIVALAFALAVTFAATGSAQNPFTIEGTVTDANNSGVAGALKTLDPSGNSSELSPLNGSVRQIGVIHLVGSSPDNPLPVLGFTSQPPKVDLNAVWTQVRMAVDGDQWFYFAWSRDAPNGSGFISIEMQQAALPAACNYLGANIDMVNNPISPAEQALIDSCNPWRNRQAGDFLILWDQQGGVINITKRVFAADPDPNAVPGSLVLGPPVDLDAVASAFAALSSDDLRGEVAVNLTAAVFGDAQQCTSIANMIPNTLTGNSDTADYKDTVLSTFPPISNCGAVDITKYTQDPSGTRFSGTGTFPYTLAREGGAALRYEEDFPGEDLTEITGTLTSDGDKDTHLSLIAGTNYTLIEDEEAMGPQWMLVSIACTVGTGTTEYSSGDIPVEIGVVTHCIITNKFVAASPAGTTVQSAVIRLFDSISITGLLNLGTPATSVTFRLYSDAACANELTGSPVVAVLSYANVGTTATADTLLTTGIPVAPGTYYWRVTYPGNLFNSGFTTACGSEATTVGVSFQQ
jgi:hypothetical protein